MSIFLWLGLVLFVVVFACQFYAWTVAFQEAIRGMLPKGTSRRVEHVIQGLLWAVLCGGFFGILATR